MARTDLDLSPRASGADPVRRRSRIGTWRRRAVALAVAATAASGLTVAAGPPAQAYAADRAFFWTPSATTGGPLTGDYASTTCGRAAPLSYTRLSTGAYRVWLGCFGTGNYGNVQISAYNGVGSTQKIRCSTHNWSKTPTGVYVYVRCRNAAGVLTNSRFTGLYTRDVSRRASESAAALVSASGAMNPSARWSSSGAAPVLLSHSPGIYTLRMSGLDRPDGTALATAYTTGLSYCVVRSVRPASTGAVVVVGCHTRTGALTDSAFSLLYTAGTVPTGRGAHAHVLNPTGTTWHAATRSWSSGSPSVYVRAVSDGAGPATEVWFPSLRASGSTNLMVTAVGSGGRSCSVDRWIPAGSGRGTVATIRCRTAGGTAVRQPFSVVYDVA